MLYNIYEEVNIMIQDKILYVCDNHKLPYYLEKYADNITIYTINLNDTAEHISDDLYEFWKSKKFTLTIAEGKCAFYAMQHSGDVRLLINPIVTPTPSEKDVYNYYINMIYSTQNKIETITWFADKHNPNIEECNKLFYKEQQIINKTVNLMEERFRTLYTREIGEFIDI